MVTRAQLAKIEWAGRVTSGNRYCPACFRGPVEGHAADCWLAAALAQPPVTAPASYIPENDSISAHSDPVTAPDAPPVVVFEFVRWLTDSEWRALIDAARAIGFTRAHVNPPGVPRLDSSGNAVSVTSAAMTRECAHGHRERVVGCVSCVLVFDNQQPPVTAPTPAYEDDDSSTAPAEQPRTDGWQGGHPLRGFRDAPVTAPAPCIGNDPLCPCQDGDSCHYRDTATTKAMPVPVTAPAAMPPTWQDINTAPDDQGVWVWNGETFLAMRASKDSDDWYTDIDGESIRVSPSPTHWHPAVVDPSVPSGWRDQASVQMPPVEVGDWIMFHDHEVAPMRRQSEADWYERNRRDVIIEQRKSNGTIWRRPAPAATEVKP